MNTNEPILKIDHLKKSFGTKTVLRDVNIEVMRGEITCIIGQSGHGKSVILKNIMGLMKPDGGRISFNGDVISSPITPSTEYDKVRHKFGLLFQGAALFDSMTVGDNIGFPLRERTNLTAEEIDERIRNGLEMVGLHNIEEQMPAELSGGMRSRVGLARAVAMEPDIMLYDEPTSALDPIMSDKINDLILGLREKLNMTSVVITHDMGSAYKIADRICMLHNGRIIFQGTPAEIRSSRNAYIKKFISGHRKLFYAMENEGGELDQQVNIDTVQKESDKKTFRGVTELKVIPKKRTVGDT